jgi:hypothetical protein
MNEYILSLNLNTIFLVYRALKFYVIMKESKRFLVQEKFLSVFNLNFENCLDSY